MAAIEITDTDALVLTDEQRRAQYFVVTCMFIDYPIAYSQNFRTPRNKFFFGYAQIMYGDYVQETIPLEYDGQIICQWWNYLAQVNAYIDCAIRRLRDLIIESHNLEASKSVMVPFDYPPPVSIASPITSVRFQVISGAKILVNIITAPLQVCSPVEGFVEPLDPPSPRDEGDKLGTNPPSLADDTGELNGRGGIQPKEEEVEPPPEEIPPGTEKKIIVVANAEVYKAGGGTEIITTPVFEGVFPWPIAVDPKVDQPSYLGDRRDSWIDILSNSQVIATQVVKIEGHLPGTYNYAVQYADP